jgi:mannitol-1-phosphate 5-dehydrogenase
VALSGDRTFVGFGFGAIQAGLFFYEAYRSGNFGHLVVAEVQPGVVKSLRDASGMYSVNVAHLDHIEFEEIGPVEIANPQTTEGAEFLVQRVAEAEEIATALPSVRFYCSDAPGSIHRILAEGLMRKAASEGPPAVIYAAENHNTAAEELEEAVFSVIPKDEQDKVRSRVRFLNTVIGKMSGVVVDPDEMRSRQLIPVTPDGDRAFLVEEFNRILISRIHFDDPAIHFQRGITVFAEKDHLLPFEEAKLWGHNATHALAAYIGSIRGAKRIDELKDAPGVVDFLRTAFIGESGRALIARNRGEDALFTPEGFSDYAEDLLVRMFNPYLGDTVERVGRDAARKLTWDDRLIGTIRAGLRNGQRMRRFGFGAAAAACVLDPALLNSKATLEAALVPIWDQSSPDSDEKRSVLCVVEEGWESLRVWREQQFPHLESFIQGRK